MSGLFTSTEFRASTSKGEVYTVIPAGQHKAQREDDETSGITIVFQHG